jgi:hypothetical protein
MKKLFTLAFAMLAMTATEAEEKTVWEGNEAISWNTEAAPGTQFETPEGTFTGLQTGNTIRIYTTTTYEEPQYVVTYKKGDGWEWTDLETTFANSIISYVVADDQTATEIAERGIILRGQAWTATKITIEAETIVPVLGEQTIWEGSEPISWNTEVAPGTQFETPEGIFANLKNGDTIRAYTTTSYEEPQYVLTYKKGDSWEWTDLDIEIEEGVIIFTVEDDQTADEISGRGLIFRGQAYTLTKITLSRKTTTAIAGIKDTPRIVTAYNLSGQKIGNQYKGLVIINGKKYIRR